MYNTKGQNQSYGTNVIYIVAQGDTDKDDYFFSPDGIGKVYFDSLGEAMDETGITNTMRIG